MLTWTQQFCTDRKQTFFFIKRGKKKKISVDIQYIHNTQRFWKGGSEKGRWVKLHPEWPLLVVCTWAARQHVLYRPCPQQTTWKHCGQVTRGHSFLWSVNVRPVGDDVCFFPTVTLTWLLWSLSICAASFYYCGDAGARHTEVDLSQHSPHWHLTANVCHFTLRSALVLRSSICSLEAVSCELESLSQI